MYLGTDAARLRPLWTLSFFVLLGALGTLALTSFSTARTAVALIVLVGIVLIPIALGQSFEKVTALVKSLQWWHGLWLILFLSELGFRTRDDQSIGQSLVDPSAAFRIALVAIAALILTVRLTLRQTPWVGSLCRGLVGILAIYALISASSTLWSVYPSWTLYKSFEYFVDVCLLAAILATVRSVTKYKTLFDWSWTLYGLVLVSVWLGALVWPKEALLETRGLFGRELSGVFPIVSANSVGEYGAILAVVALCRLLLRSGEDRDRVFYSLVFTAAFITLVIAQGRSAITGLLFGAVLVLLFSKRAAVATLTVATTLLLWLLGGTDLFSTYFRRGQDTETFNSLSGVEYWQFSMHELMKRPWTGYGAYTDRFVILAKLGEGDTSSVHSTYVAALVGMSVWGLIPIVVALAGVWWILFRTLRRFPYRSMEYQLAVEAVGVLAIVTVRSFFTIHLVWHTSEQFLVILGFAEFLRRRQNYLARQYQPNAA